jgi:hypothetical protein
VTPTACRASLDRHGHLTELETAHDTEMGVSIEPVDRLLDRMGWVRRLPSAKKTGIHWF